MDHHPLNLPARHYLNTGYVIPVCYLMWSLKWGSVSGPNPWGASGLEWKTISPPPPENLIVTPHVTTVAYDFAPSATRWVHPA